MEAGLEVWGLLILGLVQGISEFLPISSSGHLLLLGRIFGIEDSLFVSIFLHMATLLSIMVVFRKEIWSMIIHPFSKEAISLCLASIPTCLIAIVLMPFVKLSFNGEHLYISFLISAFILLFVQMFSKNRGKGGFSHKNALAMGIAQGFAVFPGISRSGTTISAGLLSGGDKKECAKFSFLLSIPIILASMVGEVFEIFKGGTPLSVNPLGLVLGFLVAFVSGLLSIKFMIRATERANFLWISGYLVVMSILSMIIM